MSLKDIIDRTEKPVPWSEGDNIPWHDPVFSERMLAEHLSQEHDRASRRTDKIDQQVAWIHANLLSGRPSRILDLACGPGLYSRRLAALGHECTGIDYSPASIAHAREEAKKGKHLIQYQEEDLRTATYPKDHDLVLVLYGELNVFSKPDAGRILRNAAQSMTTSGRLVLEVHAEGVIPEAGKTAGSWYSAKSGLWSDSPHICLQESFWDPERKVATIRYFVVDAATGQTKLSSASYQDYSNDEYMALLTESGFKSLTHHASLIGGDDEEQHDFTVLVAGL